MKSTLLLFATAISSVSAGISWKMEAACGGSIPFSSSIVTILCDGSSDDCQLGDTAVFTGSVTASDAFEDDNVFVKTCIASVCPEMAQKDAGKLCDWLTPAKNGQECGEAGDYVIYHSEEIPEYEGVSSYVLEAVTVHFVIGDEDMCSIRGYFSKAYSMMNEYYHGASSKFDQYYNDASSMMGFSMMALASLALTGGCLCRKKKSYRARAAGTATDDEAPPSYVEMKDQDVAVVV